MADRKELMCIIYDTSGSPVVYHMRDTQDLGKLVESWCTRRGINVTTTILQIKRNGRCLSLFDMGTIARNEIIDGDQLVELVL